MVGFFISMVINGAAHITFNLHGDHDNFDDGGTSATNQSCSHYIQSTW
jgi:hypothetical protein